MPIQAPQWTEFLTCPVCYNEFDIQIRRPISIGCGHTICHSCLSKLSKQQCPFDQTEVHTNIEDLPLNYGLMQLISSQQPPDSIPLNVEELKDNQEQFDTSRRCIEELAIYLKSLSNTLSGNTPNGMANGANFSNGNSNGPISKPMLRKLVTLVNCQLVEEEGRCRALRAARSLGERTVKELILQHQNPQQLSTNLWACVRSRGCQFLGPAMQEEVLKFILLALEDGNSLSRKVLVLFVVNRLENQFHQASKTSIGHVVQLLYRASCFKVTKREGDSSLLQLHEKYRTYSALRKEHDTQIVQIAMEAGLHISPEQWSALLYGDDEHKSHMQSIIDKLQTPASFSSSIQELIIALQRSGDPADLQRLRTELDRLSEIDPNPEGPPPSWEELSEVMKALKTVVQGLVDYIQNHSTRVKGSTDAQQQANNKFKTSMCRDVVQRGQCPRGINCSFAHSDEELDRHRRRRIPASKAFANGVQRNGNSSSPETIGNMSNGLENGYCNGDSLERASSDSPVNDSSGTPSSQNLTVAISPDCSSSISGSYRRINQQDQPQLLLQQTQNRVNGMHISSSPHPPHYGNGVGPNYGTTSRPFQSSDRNGNIPNGYFSPQPHHNVNGVSSLNGVNGVTYPRPDSNIQTEPRTMKYVMNIPTTSPVIQHPIQATQGRAEQVYVNGNTEQYYDYHRQSYPRITPAPHQVIQISPQHNFQQAYFTTGDGRFPTRPEVCPSVQYIQYGYFEPGARGPRDRERNGSDGGSSSDGSNSATPREPVSRGCMPPGLRDDMQNDLKLDSSSLSDTSFETSKEDNLKLCGGGDSLFDTSFKSDRFNKSRVSSIGSAGIDGSSAEYSSETLSSPFSNGSSHQGSPLSAQYSHDYSSKAWEQFDRKPPEQLPPPPKLNNVGKPDASIWAPPRGKQQLSGTKPLQLGSLNPELEMFASKFKDKWESPRESRYSRHYNSFSYFGRNGYVDDRLSKTLDRQANLDGSMSEDMYSSWRVNDRKSLQPPPGLTSRLKMTME